MFSNFFSSATGDSVPSALLPSEFDVEHGEDELEPPALDVVALLSDLVGIFRTLLCDFAGSGKISDINDGNSAAYCCGTVRCLPVAASVFL